MRPLLKGSPDIAGSCRANFSWGDPHLGSEDAADLARPRAQLRSALSGNRLRNGRAMLHLDFMGEIFLYRFCTATLLLRLLATSYDLLESVSYASQKTCQVRGSNPCRGAKIFWGVLRLTT